MLINHGMDYYKEGYLDDWKLGLPLHLCDFSSASIILYFITKKREFFLFAFFAGFSGAGMAILTPDSTYAFPDIHYIRHMIGHAMILLGVTYAMIIDGHRPYLKDVHRVLFVLSILKIGLYINPFAITILHPEFWQILAASILVVIPPVPCSPILLVAIFSMFVSMLLILLINFAFLLIFGFEEYSPSTSESKIKQSAPNI